MWLNFFPVCAENDEEAPPAEETDAQPVKRAAEEEEAEVGCHQSESARFNHLDLLMLMYHFYFFVVL